MKGNSVGTVLAAVVILSILSFFVTAGLYRVVCWAVGWSFRWRYAIAIYAVEWFLSLTFKGRSGK